MKIDIWSDFTCPWCYIGKINLEKALSEEKIEADFIYHSYQTVPAGYYSSGKSYSIYEIAQRNGMSKEQTVQKTVMIEKMGKEAGVILNMSQVKMTDTTNAHRLLQLADKYRCQDAFMMESYRLIFTEGADIGDINTLKKIAVQTGISEQDVNTLFETNNYLNQVQNDVKRASDNNITGVPYFLINDMDSLYGAQPVAAFKSIINKTERQETL